MLRDGILVAVGAVLGYGLALIVDALETPNAQQRLILDMRTQTDCLANQAMAIKRETEVLQELYGQTKEVYQVESDFDYTAPEAQTEEEEDLLC